MTPDEPKRRLDIHYLICSTPRTGSSLLCGALWHSEIAGHPDDYFGPEHLDEVPWGGDATEYCRRIFERGATPNGVAGVKTMWLDLEDLARRIQSRSGAGRVTAESVDEYFPPLRYLWTTRRDKVRQAISLAKASQTQVWRTRVGDPRATGEPVFDAPQIDEHRREIERWEVLWARYFERRSIEPLRLVYEDFVANYEDTVVRVLEWLGVPVPQSFSAPVPQLEKLADDTSEEWARLYEQWRARPHPWHRLRTTLRERMRRPGHS